MKTNINTRGFSLVETIIYIAILSIIVSALVVTAVSLLNTFTRLRAAQDISQASTVTLERLTRELRFANAVDTGASTLGSNPGTLVLHTVDASDTPTTVTTTLSGGRVMMQMGSGALVPLTHANVTISNLTFTHVVGTETEAVRVDLTAERAVKGATSTKQYRTFVVLDAS